jgi:hypothetical protein
MDIVVRVQRYGGFVRRCAAMSELTQIVSTVGFPIFAFLVTGFALKYVYDKERSSLDEAIKKLGDLTQAVNHNSEVITRMVDKMDDFNKKGE